MLGDSPYVLHGQRTHLNPSEASRRSPRLSLEMMPATLSRTSLGDCSRDPIRDPRLDRVVCQYAAVGSRLHPARGRRVAR